MERNIQKIGLVNVVVMLAIGCAAAGLAFYAKTLSGQVGSIFLGLGFLVAAISYFQMRLEETERLEKLEFEELNKAKGSASLFNITDADIFPAQRSREQFERVFVPLFTVVLFLLQGGLAYWLWTWLVSEVPAPVKEPMVTLSLFGMIALILFLLGKYSASRARIENLRLLRPGASYMLLASYLCFAVVGSLAAVQLGFERVDLLVARTLGGLLALAAVETMINLILEIYRPKVKGKEGRPLYESRVVGLLAQPEGLVTTAAQALDYQFGFKVSETWFYRFLERAIAWIILLQVAVLWLSTCLVFVSPGEQGLMERFGRSVESRAVMEPGLHLKWPWPIDTVHRVKTSAIQTFEIGFEPDPEKEEENTVLWTVPHYKTEFNFLVANRADGPSGAPAEGTGEQGAPVDLLTASIPVQYQIKDLKLWAYEHTDAGQLLQKIATREVVRYLVGVDLFKIMSSGRAEAAQELQGRIQSAAEEQKLGVNIVFVGLQDIHPPVKVARKFEEVTGALQEKEAAIRNAEGYAARTRTLAKSQAAKLVREAETYSFKAAANGRSRVTLFTNQLAAFRTAPDIFQYRMYLQALERGMTNSRKYVLATTNTLDVIGLNLEDKLRADLMDIPLPPSGRQ